MSSEIEETYKNIRTNMRKFRKQEHTPTELAYIHNQLISLNDSIKCVNQHEYDEETDERVQEMYRHFFPSMLAYWFVEHELKEQQTKTLKID